MRDLTLISLLLISCSNSKRLVIKESLSAKSGSSHIRGTFTEPVMSFIDLPLENSDTHLPPKCYELISGKTRIKAELHGKTLNLTTSSNKQVREDKVIEKLVTQ